MRSCLFLVAFIILSSHDLVGSSTLQEIRIARSVPELKKLAWKDLNVVRFLKRVRNGVPQDTRLWKLIRSYLADFEDSTDVKNTSHKNLYEIVRNPISVYRLIRRRMYFLKDVLNEAHTQGFLKTVSNWSVPKDALEDSIEAILRIHFYYNINATEFAEGQVWKVKTGAKLRAVHCYEIGVHAKSKGKFAMAIDWLKSAILLAYTDFTVDQAVVLSAMFETLETHDAAFPKAKSHLNLFTQPILKNGSRNILTENLPKMWDKTFKLEAGKRGRQSNWVVNYRGLCSGVDFQSSAEKSRLFCWLETKIHIFYTIGPLKMEFLSRSPDVVQIYDAVTETETQKIILSSENHLAASGVLGSKLHSSRSSSQVFLNTSVTNLILRKAGMMSGLETMKETSSELPQIGSYAIGGHYEPHSDSLVSEKNWGPKGDRIATFMIYLTDVEQGGYTVFTSAAATAFPVKGSAILWFNTFSDGTSDQDTQHGACPVVMGQKWVANEWIHYYDQFLKWKCSTKPQERFQFPVNGKYLPLPDTSSSEPSTEIRRPMKRHTVSVPTATEKYTYGSIPGMKALATLDWQIYKHLSSLFKASLRAHRGSLSQFHKSQSWLVKYLADYGESAYLILKRNAGADGVTEEVKKLIWSPIRAYRMLWRFEYFIKTWLSKSLESQGDLFRQTLLYLHRVYNVMFGPEVEDLNDAMLAIINTQHVHDLKATDIADGKLGNSNAGVGLKAIHCMQIGKFALFSGFYNIAVDWLEVALIKVKDGMDTTVEISTAEITLRHAMHQHDERHRKSAGWEPFFYYEPLSKVSHPETRRLRKRLSYDAYKLSQGPNMAAINYWGLCQGNEHQTPAEKSRLFCWYEKRIHPSWTIGPLKAELLSLNPNMEIVQYHDIISEEIIENLTAVPSGELTKATTGSGVVEPRKVDSSLRLSTVTWAPETSSRTSYHISALVERITGLKVLGTVGEDLQIAGYTAGSHYTVHVDTFSHHHEKHRARIATFMFYLSDVAEGGATAFVQAGVTAKPKKGSAVFWYNLYSSSLQDSFTWHGACPVIYGEKWVANKWIQWDMQTHLQCHGSSNSTRFEVLVNGVSKYT